MVVLGRTVAIFGAFIFYAPSFSIVAIAQESSPIESFLSYIETKIDSEFMEAMIHNDDTELLSLERNLYALNTQESVELESQKKYWISYLIFKHSVFYLRNQQPSKSETRIRYAMDILEGTEEINSENQALLALIKIFNFQFVPKHKFFGYRKSLNKNLKQSIQLDNNNPRAVYAQAVFDFYTPRIFGGGKKTESLLLKALDLPFQNTSMAYGPSWGKEDTLGLLIQHYIKKQNQDLASRYLNLLEKEFPNSGLLDSYNLQIKPTK